jgi:hypothetical protein
MSAASPENLIDRHEAFLECRAVERPLLGYWIGGYYPGQQYPRGTSSWPSGTALGPDDVRFGPFAADYEELYQTHRECDDDFFYVGSAYWGLPWLEAILGCPISVAAANCRAGPCLAGLDAIAGMSADLDANPWLRALLRFTRDLAELAAGRFPVCPPLLRGPGDAASSMLGGQAFVMGLIDEPEATRSLLQHCARVREEVLRRLQEAIPPWRGTHAAGGYPSKVWCRKSVAYYQEDVAALLNPRLFREFLLPLAKQACRAAEVNFIHLHSACLYPVDILLEDDCFDVLEVNVDHAGVGPPLAELIETFKRIQAAKHPLLLWGELAGNDMELIRSELSPAGLSLQPMTCSAETPRRWL